MKPILTLLYLFLFLYVVTLLVAGDSSATDTRVANISIACGTYFTAENSSGNWEGDVNTKFTPIGSSTGYQGVRFSQSEFTYRFNLTAGQKFIRFYFYPASYTNYTNFNRSKALFSVKAGDFTLLDNFNASATADASGVESYKEFCLNIDEEQSPKTFNITFSPCKDAYAFINAIQIVAMPTSLHYIENSTALERLYQLDIGGSGFYPNSSESSQMLWTDGMYLDANGVDSYNDTIQLKFLKIPEYSTEEYIYRSATSLGINKYINRSYNLTWIFPVDSSFHYLVRLHFCEFEPGITRSGERTFQIIIQNQTAEEKADIIQWSGGNGIPVYRDYVVYMYAENKMKVNLSLTLAADEKSLHNDALLNGLEIIKVFGSDISYAAAGNPDSPQVKGTKRSSTVAIVAGVISSIIVFSVIGFLVFMRGRKIKDSRSSHRTKMSMKVHKSSLPTYLCRHFSLSQIKV